MSLSLRAPSRATGKPTLRPKKKKSRALLSCCAAAATIAALKLPVNLVAAIGLVENMTGPAAYKLGDV
ncbi:MAG: hypothetical protein EBR99_03505, partial [Actinobacteria bacterium]|nr:hypothetical protein [Actinomycetota bacterium]